MVVFRPAHLHALVSLPLLAVVGSACISDGTSKSDEERMLVHLSSCSFIKLLTQPNLDGPPDAVMIGIHCDHGKSIRARLGNGYSVASSYYDSDANATQVSSSPTMHGCAENYSRHGVIDQGTKKTYRRVPL